MAKHLKPPSHHHDDTPWHTWSSATVLSKLNSSHEGLTNAEAERRLAKYGPNELQAAETASAWKLFFGQFANVLILLLLVATSVSAGLGHTLESLAILVIVLFAVFLGFIQEYRAERAMEALRKLAAPLSAVLRDGLETALPARLLVPGDVVLLRAGDKVPADCRLLETVNLEIEEAALTGESVPVPKDTAPLGRLNLPLGDRTNLVYAGTAVTQGRGRGAVVATGMDSQFGRIVRLLQEAKPRKTPLQVNLDRVGKTLVKGAVLLIAAIVALGLWRGEEPVEMLIFGIALAVAVVPEALPAVVTISLSIGAQRMLKRNALIRQLAAVETLGSTSVICSDKTGTLTKDEMTVRQVLCAGSLWDVSGVGYGPLGGFSRGGHDAPPDPALLELLGAGALACDAHVHFDEEEQRWQLKGDPTEGALVAAAAKAGLRKADLDERFPRVGEIPFSSESKRMTTLHHRPEGVVAYAKGAPEIVLASCIDRIVEGGTAVLDPAARAALLEQARDMASRALRVLAIARRADASLKNAEQGMTLLGLVGMIDPPRPEAAVAVRRCRQAGIKVVMITGDHPETARAVAGELDLLASGRVVTGVELDAMDDVILQQEVETIAVYARVSPAHKLRVVRALQANRHVTAMTGDGVNDAPALKQADIGVAMGITGTDVSKEAAAMMLTDDNFASIVAAVEEGRAIFGNIKKYLMYLLSSNLGEIGLMTGSALLGLPLPLNAVQILYVNLATDGLPALALAVDPPESDLMKRAPRNAQSGIFTPPVVALMVIGGTWSALVNLSVFAWCLSAGRSQESAMTVVFLSLVLTELLKAYNFRSDRHSLFRGMWGNRWLNYAVLWEAALLGLVVTMPLLQTVFSTVPLITQDLVLAGAAAVSVWPVLELAKLAIRRGWLGRDG